MYRMAAAYRKKTEKTTSQTELPEMPDSLKSGHVENRSQKEVELEPPDTEPKLVVTKETSPGERLAAEMALARGADSDAMAEGVATATKEEPGNERRHLA